VAGKRVDERPVLAGVDAKPADEHERVTGPGQLVVDVHSIAVSARQALNIAPRMRRDRRSESPRGLSTASSRPNTEPLDRIPPASPKKVSTVTRKQQEQLADDIDRYRQARGTTADGVPRELTTDQPQSLGQEL
jgi:hypothetical protein